MDEFVFEYVKNEVFSYFVSVNCSRFKVHIHVIVAQDCIFLYNDEKEKLKSMLSTNKQMVSLTINCWISVQNLNDMCLS